MAAANALFLLWGAIWMPIFTVLAICTVFGIYDPKDEEKRKVWAKGTWIAFAVLLVFYVIILSKIGVGLN